MRAYRRIRPSKLTDHLYFVGDENGLQKAELVETGKHTRKLTYDRDSPLIPFQSLEASLIPLGYLPLIPQGSAVLADKVQKEETFRIEDHFTEREIDTRAEEIVKDQQKRMH